MKHKPYPKYKPSGIEWIGEIPEWWSLKRIRFNFRISKGRKPEEIGLLEEEGYAPYLSMEYLRGERKEAMWAKIDRNCIKVRDGDVLLLWDGANAGEFVCGKSGVVSSTMVKIEALKGDENYFKHFFKAYENILKKNSIGMGIPHVDGNFLTNSFVILPEKKEQQQIADFLDHKTAQIDDLIQKKEEMIKLLKEKRAVIINQAVTKGLDPNAKMKPSGIDWIGDIPEQWEVRRLKYVSYFQRGFDLPVTEFQNGGVPVYGSNGIIGFHNVATTKYQSITIGRSGSVGEVNFINENYWAHNTALFLLNNYENNVRYLFYLLNCVNLIV